MYVFVRYTFSILCQQARAQVLRFVHRSARIATRE
jgi:hypothetical protein